jgi:primosomal replication protein N
MNKIFLIIAFLFFQTYKSFSQDKPRVYLSGIDGNVIKKSQLLDTTIRIVTNLDISKKGIGVEIYFSGEGYSNVKMTTVALGTKLNFVKDKLTVGSRLTVGGFTIKDPKSGKTIYFEESSYKVIGD